MLAEAIILFLLLWIPAIAISHEACHALECKLQGGNPKIHVWWYTVYKLIKIPSMLCTCSKLTCKQKFFFAGGLYNSAILLALTGLFYFIYLPLSVVLFIYAVIQFLYGIYEGLYISKLTIDEYMKYKNVVYAIGFLVAIGILLGVM